MITIVMNTATGAVTEYGWSFNSIGPRRAGSGAGLLALGGDTDAGAPIAARIVQGRTTLGSTLKKGAGIVFLAMRGDAAVSDEDATARLIVQGRSDEWPYDFPINPRGVSRCETGLGIDENYLALGFENVDGADFALDAIEPEAPQSRQRRT